MLADASVILRDANAGEQRSRSVGPHGRALNWESLQSARACYSGSERSWESEEAGQRSLGGDAEIGGQGGGDLLARDWDWVCAGRCRELGAHLVDRHLADHLSASSGEFPAATCVNGFCNLYSLLSCVGCWKSVEVGKA